MDFLLCELLIRRDYTLLLRECDIFSISPEFAGLQEISCGAARIIFS
jgi:hypothetical protein